MVQVAGVEESALASQGHRRQLQTIGGHWLSSSDRNSDYQVHGVDVLQIGWGRMRMMIKKRDQRRHDTWIKLNYRILRHSMLRLLSITRMDRTIGRWSVMCKWDRERVPINVQENMIVIRCVVKINWFANYYYMDYLINTCNRSKEFSGVLLWVTNIREKGLLIVKNLMPMKVRLILEFPLNS